MIIPAEIRRRYSHIEPVAKKLESLVQASVFNYCCTQGFAYVGRVKTLESLSEKLESGRYQRFSEVDDIFACVIVVPTLDREAEVVEFLRSAFECVSIKKRGSTQKQPESFRFDATRFIGQLKSFLPADPDALLYSMHFEVQIRSAFEHAWSVTTHALHYKTAEVDWKYQRLAAQLKAVVEQLDSLTMVYAAAAAPIVEHNWPELIAKQKVVSCFRGLIQNGEINEIFAPKDWSRFAENFFALLRFHGERSHQAEASLEAALDAVQQHVKNNGVEAVPRSLSLLQYSFGVLAEVDLIRPPTKRYCPLITPELEDFFPKTRGFQDRVIFDV